MPGLIGDRPPEVFRQFREHIGRLLNTTVTDARLALLSSQDKPYASITFRDEQGVATAAHLRGSNLFLFLSQSLVVEQQKDKTWTLRTQAYSYHILEGAAQDSRWLVRWEYISRSQRIMEHPRHHVHLPVKLETLDGEWDLNTLHLSTGWVTVEEVIRFLIVEARIRPKVHNWDEELIASEEKFKEWTSRTV